MALPNPLTFRIQHIPSHFTKYDLVHGIRNVCDATERNQLEVVGDLVPSISTSDPEQTAVVFFLPQSPNFLRNVLEDKSGAREEQVLLSLPGRASAVVSIDRHFVGLTQLYRPVDGEISMDIVAITGLDGNAFGSWKSRQSNRMWLRDFLRKDLPSCRVMTYGCNLKLACNMLHTFQDLCAEFLEAMKVARASAEAKYRPLVLIGHSYGCRIVTKSLVRCKLLDYDSVLKALLSATQAVVFFGGPHRGMITEDIENYLADHFPDHRARQKMVAELRQDDDGTKRELQDFIDLVGSFFVISIYERKPSRALVPQRGEGQSRKWDRVGQEYIPVAENSAVLNLPSRLEVRIPSDSDHSNMAKFDHKDPTYQALLGYLKDTEKGSSLSAYPWMSVLNSAKRRLRSQEKSAEAEADTPDHNALIDVAIDAVRSYRTLQARGLELNESESALLPNIESALLETRSYILLLQSLERKRENCARAIVMDYSEALNDLIVLLDIPRNNAANSSLYVGQHFSQFLRRLEWLNQRANKTLSPEISPHCRRLGRDSAPDRELSKQFATLANMAMSLQPEFHGLSLQDPQWVPYTDLYFPADASSDMDREGKNWLERLVQTFTQFQGSNLKLQTRRFGALSRGHEFLKVMVEFRPYIPDLWKIRPLDYERQRWQVLRLGRMLQIATSQGAAAPFLCVPLLFLSECRTSSPPVFVLIYGAEGLYSLDEGIKYIPPPPSAQRLRLALGIAKAVAALHLAGIVHGGINTENVYLRYPPGMHAGGGVSSMNIDEVMPMLAGFDIARDFAGDSSKLDVEDPELRVYLHPERMAWGGGKEMQHPRYDVFSLGMAMIEIGLWQRFKSFQKYHEAETDEERQRFSIRLRGHFEGNGNDGRMDGRYRAVVSYCLGRRAQPVDVDGGSEMDNLHGATVSPLGAPNAVQVVQALANILAERNT